MARYSGAWGPTAYSGSEMTATHCAPVLTYTNYETPQTYRLKQGPIRTPNQVTCQWSWVPSTPNHTVPDSGIPESIICNLFLSQF
jgi:hypothetical protein